jgi:hypothetical protein
MSKVCSFRSCVAGTGRSLSAYLTPRGACDGRLPSGWPEAAPAGRQPTARRCPPHYGVAASPAARAAPRARGAAGRPRIPRPTWAAPVGVPDRRRPVAPSGGRGLGTVTAWPAQAANWWGPAQAANWWGPAQAANCWWPPARVRVSCRHIRRRNRFRPSAEPTNLCPSAEPTNLTPLATPSCCPVLQRVSTVPPPARAANPSTALAPPAPARGAAVALAVRAAGRAGALVGVAAKRIGARVRAERLAPAEPAEVAAEVTTPAAPPLCDVAPAGSPTVCGAHRRRPAAATSRPRADGARQARR